MRITATTIGWPLMAAVVTAGMAATAPTLAQIVASAPANTVQVATGRGKLITLAHPMSDLFVADDKIADVQVRSPTQLYVFGKTVGETTMYATAKNGTVVYSATVRVGNNIDSLSQMLQLALPDATIAATPLNGLVLLTGTVATPGDIAEAERLVQAFVGDGTKVLTRLKTATPLQVNLQVKFAEVSRSFAKDISSNLATRDQTGGFQGSIGSGRQPGAVTQAQLGTYPTATINLPNGTGTITGPYDPTSGQFVNPRGTGIAEIARGSNFTTIGLAGKLLGLDVLQAIDLGERSGQVSTLAEPNLTALSGETGTFLAGGEIPIPVSQGLGAVSVEYKQYGISLAYTPTVLADGRISLRVRPEVSQLTSAGAVQINGTTIPALSTRRAETTVELGSGQSFMIAGLLQNDHNNSIEQTPGIGNVPILGALFRSNGFRRNETELVIVITPYLVKPVNANDIVLPTDGYKAPTDLGRIFLGELGGGQTGGDRPKPSVGQPAGSTPAIGIAAPVGPAPTPRPLRGDDEKALAAPSTPKKAKADAAAQPGFSFK